MATPLTQAGLELGFLQLALNSHAIVSATDPAGIITYVNEKFCLVSGYSQEELLGATHRIVKSEFHPPDFFSSMWSTISSNQIWHGEVCNRRKDGRLYWVESTIVPFCDGKGAVYKYVSIRTDITRQKKTEQLLEAISAAQSEIISDVEPSVVFNKLLSEILLLTDSSAGLIVENREADRASPNNCPPRLLAIATASKDAQGNPNCLVHAVDHMQGLNVRKLFPAEFSFTDAAIENAPQTGKADLPSDHPCLENLLHLPFLRGPQVVGFLILANRPGGYDPSVVDLLTPLTNTCASMIEGIRNKEAHKVTLAALRASNQKVELASEAKSEFLSRMTHELRTPLNAIIGFSQLMESDTVDVLPPSQRENVEQILKAGWHLRELIDDVLDLSQMEAGHADLQNELFDLRDTVEESFVFISPLAHQRNIQMHLNVQVEAATIRSDATRVKQIVTNLLSNAVKYNKPNGEVVVSITASDQEWVVAVADSGRGIAQEDLSDVFKPFTRVGDKRSVAGTGIGLDISKRFAELMGGRIEVISQLGAGSTFTLKLPRSII